MTELDFNKDSYDYALYYDDNGELVGINDYNFSKLSRYKITVNKYGSAYHLELYSKSGRSTRFYQRLILNYGLTNSIIYQDEKDLKNVNPNIDYIRFTVISHKLDLPEKLKRAWIDLAYETIFKRT